MVTAYRPAPVVRPAPAPKPVPVSKPASASKSAPVVAGTAPKSIAQLKAHGYVQKGTVSKGVTASKIAGGKWNAPDTYYTIRDKVIPGNAIDAAHIEVGMCVWMKK